MVVSSDFNTETMHGRTSHHGPGTISSIEIMVLGRPKQAADGKAKNFTAIPSFLQNSAATMRGLTVGRLMYCAVLLALFQMQRQNSAGHVSPKKEGQQILKHVPYHVWNPRAPGKRSSWTNVGATPASLGAVMFKLLCIPIIPLLVSGAVGHEPNAKKADQQHKTHPSKLGTVSAVLRPRCWASDPLVQLGLLLICPEPPSVVPEPPISGCGRGQGLEKSAESGEDCGALTSVKIFGRKIWQQGTLPFEYWINEDELRIIHSNYI